MTRARVQITHLFSLSLALSLLPVESLAIVHGSHPRGDSLIARSSVAIHTAYEDCSGSVLSANIILTAGHCVSDVNSRGERVLLAANEISVLGIRADRIVMNPAYFSQVDYDHYDFGRDIALIHLSKKLPNGYTSVILEKDESQVYQQDLQFAGYGGTVLLTTDYESSDTPSVATGRIDLKDKLSIGDGNAQKASSASQSYRLQFSGKRNGASLCHGDSGGPIFYEKDGRIHQVGVIVGFIPANEADARRFRCAIETSSEIGSTVFGANAGFIDQGYRELSGVSP